jgi:hypothetical protein
MVVTTLASSPAPATPSATPECASPAPSDAHFPSASRRSAARSAPRRPVQGPPARRCRVVPHRGTVASRAGRALRRVSGWLGLPGARLVVAPPARWHPYDRDGREARRRHHERRDACAPGSEAAPHRGGAGGPRERWRLRGHHGSRRPQVPNHDHPHPPPARPAPRDAPQPLPVLGPLSRARRPVAPGVAVGGRGRAARGPRGAVGGVHAAATSRSRSAMRGTRGWPRRARSTSGARRRSCGSRRS